MVVSFYCWACFGIELTGDSIEHINTTWLISTGLVPYRDFFQHHHPLLWYLMIPVVNLFETYNSSYIIPVYRTISIINTLLCSWILYKICKRCTKMPYMAFLSVLLFLSLDTVYVFSLVLRPDNFMLLFGLWGFYILLKYRQTQNIKLLYFCGFLFFISFMFLQKIIFLFMAIAVFVHEDIQHKKLKWMPFIKTGMYFVGSYILFLWG
ncbi:MAG: glycosyltransferase family 39 protein [Alphaproteobacteria bacterium]|nr:glycosyltransferase family 39 protein [Alphaproteobacteria bacterium]